MEKLNERILEQIIEETGIAPNKAKDDIAIIRNWVNQQPHLPNLEDDEETNEWLYNYLFYSKNRIEKVKKHLEIYFSCKTLMPEFFLNRDPEEEAIKGNVQALHLVTLPKLTPQGFRVHIFSHATQDPNAYEPIAFMRRTLMMCDWKMKYDKTAGDIIILHTKNSSLGHWARYNLSTLSQFVSCFSNAFPLRIKAIHFTNASTIVSHLMNNHFMPEKLKNRFTVSDKTSKHKFNAAIEMKAHNSGNISELIKDIPQDCLPKELGGTLSATLDELNELTYQNIRNMKGWFLENESMKTDESKRLNKLKKNELFGCDGTFRALNLD